MYIVISVFKAEYEIKVGEEINEIEQQWLEVLKQEEEDVWIEDNGV